MRADTAGCMLAVQRAARHAQRRAGGGYVHLVGQDVDGTHHFGSRWCPTCSVPAGWKVFLDVNHQIGLGELAAQPLNLSLQFNNRAILPRTWIDLRATLTVDQQALPGRCDAAYASGKVR
jgi:hypothetical protein